MGCRRADIISGVFARGDFQLAESFWLEIRAGAVDHLGTSGSTWKLSHLIQLLIGSQLLGKQSCLYAMEKTFKPAHKLSLCYS